MNWKKLATNEEAAVLVGRKISRVEAIDEDGVVNAYLVLDDNTVVSFDVEDHGSGTYTVMLETNHPYFVQKVAKSQISESKRQKATRRSVKRAR